jgi:tetratricopeptide (TPR) repeat protein
MNDLSNLAKFYHTGAVPAGVIDITNLPWWVENNLPPMNANTKYDREFLFNYLLHYCRLCFRLDRFGIAPYLDKLLNMEPENGELHFLRAAQFEYEDDLPSALEFYERAAALSPDKPTYMIASAKMAVKLGKRHKAMAMLAGVIDAFPAMAEARYERGKIYEQDENWARAKQEYEACINLDQKSVTYLCACACAYRHLKLYKAAQRLLKKALQLDPNNRQAQEELRQISLFDQLFDLSRPDDSSARI